MIRKVVKARFVAIVLMFVCAVAVTYAASYTPASVPKPGRDAATPYVINPDGIIPADVQTRLNASLKALADTTSAEVVVVVIDRMDETDDIDEFANELFGLWGIGKKSTDNGVLLLVSVSDRQYVTRTGRGAESVLPDVVCARIGRDVLEPAFRAGDYGKGVERAAVEISRLMADPEAAADVRAKIEREEREELRDILLTYVIISFATTLVLGLIAVITLVRKRKASRYDKYLAFRQMTTIFGWLCFVFLGMPLLVYIPLRAALSYWRNGEHKCPNCGTRMSKLPEDRDNDYLTPSQDAEERFNSVDYDVWLCPDCNTTAVYAYTNPDVNYVECDHCHARTSRLISDKVVSAPTTNKDGVGVREYKCLNCKHVKQVPYKIAKTAAPTVVILPGGGGGFRGGGGGFGGFGGGMTGGGGASGRW